jgi:hypothetical protein
MGQDMSFFIKKGRPEGTQETDQGVIHYTCNPPNVDVLNTLGVLLLGDRFGVDPREVLLIPDSLFDEHGLARDTIGAETLLARVSRK